MAGTDYIGVTNTIVFPRGETFETVLIPIIDNHVVDGDRVPGIAVIESGERFGPGAATFCESDDPER